METFSRQPELPSSPPPIDGLSLGKLSLDDIDNDSETTNSSVQVHTISVKRKIEIDLPLLYTLAHTLFQILYGKGQLGLCSLYDRCKDFEGGSGTRSLTGLR